jgi:hypothetical protein
MQKSLLTKFFFILWAVLWVTVFIFIPSRVDFIHGETFGGFEEWLPKLILFNPAIAIRDVFYAFGAVSLLALVYIALGSSILRLFSRDYYGNQNLLSSSWVALVCTSFILGHAAFSFIFILFGTNHLFTANYLLAVLLAGILISIPSLKVLYNKLKFTIDIRISALWNRVNHKTIFILTIGVLLLGLFYTSTRLSYDAVAIYFSDEKLTSLNRQIDFFQGNSFIASSFQTGITYAALITLAGDQAARMYSWVNGLIIILLALSLAKELGLSRQARLIFLTFLLTSTAFVDLTGDGKIDLISTAPAVAAVYWTIINTKRKNKSIAVLTGTMAGIAIVSRPFNIFLACLFIGTYYALSFLSTKDKTERLAIIKLIPFLVYGVIVPAISLFIVNQLILGNPLSFLYNLQMTNSSNWQWTFDRDKLWIIRLLYPFALTVINIPQSNGNISPLFVVFLPVLLTRNSITKLKTLPYLLRASAAAIITLTVWNIILFTVFEIRYVLFLWAIIYLALAVAIEETIFTVGNDIGRFSKVAIIAVLLFINARMIYIIVGSYSPVDNTNAPHCTNHDLCAILDPINENALPGERVFTLSAFRYYLRPDLLACSSKHNDYQLFQQLANNNTLNFWTELYKQGFRYVSFEPRYSRVHLGFDIVPEKADIPEWMELRSLSSSPNGYASYEIVANNPPVAVQKTCAQTPVGTWLLKDIK